MVPLENLDALRSALSSNTPARVQFSEGALSGIPPSRFEIPDIVNSAYRDRYIGTLSAHVFPELVADFRSVCRFKGSVINNLELLPSYYADVIPRIDAARQNVGSLRHRHIDESIFVCHTPKYREYGHFLIETLPRLLIAKELYRKGFELPILIPADRPSYFDQFLLLVFYGENLRVVEFDDTTEAVTVKTGCLISAGMASFHPLLRNMIDDATAMFAHENLPKKIFIVRQGCRSTIQNDYRVLENEEELVNLAESHGFFILEPQRYTIAEQVAYFRNADFIVGEASSALHNCLFSLDSTSVLSMNYIHNAQTAIAALKRHSIDYVLPDGGPRNWDTASRIDGRYKIDAPSLHNAIIDIERVGTRRSA